MERVHNARVAVVSPSFCRDRTLMAELAAVGLTVVANPSPKVLAADELATFLAASGAEIAIIGREHIDGELLDRCPGLRLVAKYGVGIDNLDLEAMTTRGVELGWTAGVNRRGVAELVVAFLLGHFRNVAVSGSRLRQGAWKKDGGRELNELTLGIIGFGHCGSEVAKLLASFGMKLRYCDVVDKSKEARDLGAEQRSYEELLKEVDAVTFHVPLTPATNRMFGAETLALMQAHALVINTSRGEVVDFEVTCEAVKAGRLGGFAADVFEVEPADLTPWRTVERLYFTPHIGGNSQAAVWAMGRSAIGHVKAWVTR